MIPGEWIFRYAARPYELIVYQRAWRANAQKMLAKLAPGTSRRILDAGCGPGVSALAMREHGPSDLFVGFDLSLPMLRRAAAHRQSEGVSPEAFPLVRGDVTRLPFGTGLFDGVTGHSFLYLLPDQPRALLELRRVLRPGGRLVLLEPAAGSSFGPVVRSLRHGLRFAVSMGAWRVVSGRIGRFTAEHLRSTLAQAGFTSIDVEPVLDGLGLLAAATR